MKKIRNKKGIGKVTVVTIIVLVAIVISAVVIGNATGFVLSGLLSFLGPSATSLNKVHSMTEAICRQPDADIKATIVVPKDHVIRVTEYDTATIGSYTECIGGFCLCIMRDQWECSDPRDPKTCKEPENYLGPANQRYLQVPPSGRNRYCKPLIYLQSEPIFCCVHGECDFKNVGGVPNLNVVRMNGITPYNGLLFNEQNFVAENYNLGASEEIIEYYDPGLFCASFEPGGPYIVNTDFIDGVSTGLSISCCYPSSDLGGACQNIKNFDAGTISMTEDGLPAGQYQLLIEKSFSEGKNILKYYIVS